MKRPAFCSRATPPAPRRQAMRAIPTDWGGATRVVDSLIGLVRAPNPSPMTLDGTNSYVFDGGSGEAICMDPGPAVETHVEAVLQRARQMHCTIAAICLTHGHP